MKKRKIVIVLILLLLDGWALGKASWIANGSFEYGSFKCDEIAINNIQTCIPMGWHDVDVPWNFSGAVSSSWATDGDYSLILFSNSSSTFEPDDIATLSQRVYLDDVNEIIFDLNLETVPGAVSWDPTKRSAVIMIDDDVVWDSSTLGAGDLSGEYFDLIVDMSETAKYRDGQWHLLSFGLRSNVLEEWAPMIKYYAKWDYIGFDTHCRGGIGFLDGDFNCDCYVDEYDLEMFTDHWLDEVNEPNIFNLYDDNSIDFMDYAIFANNWMSDSYKGAEEILEYDLNPDGIVNFVDYAMLENLTLIEPNQPHPDVNDLINEWLETNWTYGL